MEVLKVGAWMFGIVFLFAVIGVIAVIKWILDAFRKTEAAVEGGVHNVQGRFTHRDP